MTKRSWIKVAAPGLVAAAILVILAWPRPGPDVSMEFAGYTTNGLGEPAARFVVRNPKPYAIQFRIFRPNLKGPDGWTNVVALDRKLQRVAGRSEATVIQRVPGTGLWRTGIMFERETRALDRALDALRRLQARWRLPVWPKPRRPAIARVEVDPFEDGAKAPGTSGR